MSGWGRPTAILSWAHLLVRAGAINAGLRWVSWLVRLPREGYWTYSCGTAPDFRRGGHRFPLDGPRVRARGHLSTLIDCEGEYICLYPSRQADKGKGRRSLVRGGRQGDRYAHVGLPSQ